MTLAWLIFRGMVTFEHKDDESLVLDWGESRYAFVWTGTGADSLTASTPVSAPYAWLTAGPPAVRSALLFKAVVLPYAAGHLQATCEKPPDLSGTYRRIGRWECYLSVVPDR
jgi:hypothetical protein